MSHLIIQYTTTPVSHLLLMLVLQYQAHCHSCQRQVYTNNLVQRLNKFGWRNSSTQVPELQARVHWLRVQVAKICTRVVSTSSSTIEYYISGIKFHILYYTIFENEWSAFDAHGHKLSAEQEHESQLGTRRSKLRSHEVEVKNTRGRGRGLVEASLSTPLGHVAFVVLLVY